MQTNGGQCNLLHDLLEIYSKIQDLGARRCGGLYSVEVFLDVLFGGFFCCCFLEDKLNLGTSSHKKRTF